MVWLCKFCIVLKQQGNLSRLSLIGSRPSKGLSTKAGNIANVDAGAIIVLQKVKGIIGVYLVSGVGHHQREDKD